jgi:hypothetical protein
MADNKVLFGSTFVDEYKFLQYLASRYGSWSLALGYRGIYAFQLQNSPLYREWIKEGKPATGKRFGRGEAPTAETTLQDIRGQITPEGHIPYKGNEAQQPYLESIGYELVESDALGELLHDNKYFQEKEEEAPPVTTRPRVETIDGVRFLVVTAPDGTVRYEPYGEAPTQDVDEGPTEWQQYQMQKDVEDRNWARQQEEEANERAQQGLLAEQYGYQAQRLANYGRDVDAERAELKRLKNEMEYDSFIRSRIAALSASPRSWIDLYKWQNEPNPFAVQQRTPEEEVVAAEKEVKLYQAASNILSKREKDPTDPLFVSANPNISNQPLTPEQTFAAGIRQRLRNAEDKLIEFTIPTEAEAGAADITGTTPEKIRGLAHQWASNREHPDFANVTPEEQRALMAVAMESGFGDKPAPPAPTMPEIPRWLQTASGITGRVPKTRQPMLTPSGQSWSRLNPTQREMFAGLSDFAGERPFEDVIGQTQSMLPQAPSLGSNRWSAALQV